MTHDTEGLYNRQETMSLRIPASVTIVGVGGVGSWVAYFFALVGVPVINVIDPDRVEESNRNRTPFHVWHVGDYKADSLVEIVMECREQCVVTPYNKRYEELTPAEKTNVESELFFDCRDVVSTLDRDTPITGGYDGSEVTLHVKPDYRKVFSANDQEGYRVTPSYVVPPAFIALCIVNYCCLEKHQRGGNMDEFCFNVEMTKLVRKLAGKKRFRPRGEPASEPESPEEHGNPNGVHLEELLPAEYRNIPIRLGLSLRSTVFLPFEIMGTVDLQNTRLYWVRQMDPRTGLIEELVDEEGVTYLNSRNNS